MDRPGLLHALLLADPSPSLRVRVLRELLGRPGSDSEVRELERLRSAEDVLRGARERSIGVSETVALAIDLMRLGYAGFGRGHREVRERADRLYSLQLADGSWPLPRGRGPAEGAAERRDGYDAIPLQTAIPLRGLAMCGYAEDPRSERAYDWLERVLLPDGAWPTGVAQGVFGRVGGYRRLPHSRWGCRSNTTGALLCWAHHPARAGSEVARRALDHLLGRETHDRAAVGTEVARLVGAQPYLGFITFYAAFDAALLLDLCARIGASLEDERVRALVDLVSSMRGPAGLWEHPRTRTASRWLTLDLERSIRMIPESSEWHPEGARTAYASYPRRPRRS